MGLIGCSQPDGRRVAALPAVNISEFHGVRYLHLGTAWVHGAMLVKAPFDIELEYVRRMMAWLLFVEPDSVPQRRALQLGLGSAALTKFCWHRLGLDTTAIEINPLVVAACRQSFGLPADGDRLRVVLADATTEVGRAEHQGRYDAVQLDVYDQDAAAPLIDSVEAYSACRRLLTADGCLAVNCFGPRHRIDLTLSHLVGVFGRAAVFAFWTTREGNTVLLARQTSELPHPDTLHSRARAIQQRWGLPTERWLQMLEPVHG